MVREREKISIARDFAIVFAIHSVDSIQALDGSYKGWCAMRILQNLYGNSIARNLLWDFYRIRYPLS